MREQLLQKPLNWPQPPEPTAFSGLAGEVVRAIENDTEGEPAALLVQLLVAFGNLVGRGPHWRVGGTLTSPPYGKMRDYGGQVFTYAKFQAIARELFRITVDCGKPFVSEIPYNDEDDLWLCEHCTGMDRREQDRLLRRQRQQELIQQHNRAYMERLALKAQQDDLH
jgi:hypothetical protein